MELSIERQDKLDRNLDRLVRALKLVGLSVASKYGLDGFDKILYKSDIHSAYARIIRHAQSLGWVHREHVSIDMSSGSPAIRMGCYKYD